jgi:serine/threonine-protein kinase HipA
VSEPRVGGWSPVRRLDVLYADDGAPARVGGLAMDAEGVVFFQYDAAWVEGVRELSPFALPLSTGRSVVKAARRRELHDLHGLFADSMPDAWGMRLLTQAFLRRGIDPQRVGPLDRLALLVEATMGALTYAPASDWDAGSPAAATLDELARMADGLEWGALGATPGTKAGARADSIDALVRAAGGSGGAQPKVLMGPQLVKFTPSRALLGLRADAGLMEYAYVAMARDAAIDVPETMLLSTTDGRRHFASRRFDRSASGARRHVQTFGGLLERAPSDHADYDELFRVGRRLTRDARVVEALFRRMCFNLAVVNDDDHPKNVSFVMAPSGDWSLAPAYDLTYSPGRGGLRGMSVDGRDGDVTWAVAASLGARHGLATRTVEETIEQVRAVAARWAAYGHDVGLADASIAEVAEALEVRGRALHG